MLTVQLAPTPDVPAVRYRWDADTDILSAECEPAADPHADAPATVREGAAVLPPPGAARSGAIEVEGDDGSWLSLEVVRGRIAGVQVAVWPTVRRRRTLDAPGAPPCAAFAMGGHAAGDATVALEVSGSVAAETDAQERTFHFRFGPPRETERARIARDVVLEIDRRQRLAGLWLTNVPPLAPDPSTDAPHLP
jgi:hypothetical protein